MNVRRGYPHAAGTATRPAIREIRMLDWEFPAHPGKPLDNIRRPQYVDNEAIGFKHPSSDIVVKFYSKWEDIEKLTAAGGKVCPIYFPRNLEVSLNTDLEARLVRDLQNWGFLQCFKPPLMKLGLNLCRSASIDADVPYEQRVILSHYFTWIFLADEVTEMFPCYGLHSTAGKIYLENLKSILVDGPTEDLSQFSVSCNEKLIRSAIDAQDILSDDILPLMKKTLSAHHFEMCIKTLDLYFNNQYYEGHAFLGQPTSQEVLRTRGFTIGTCIIFLLLMTSEEAELYQPEDPCLIQLSILVALFHDLIGIHKDRASLQRHDDASANLNLILLSTQEDNLTQDEAVLSCARKLNEYTANFEFFISSYMPQRQRFYYNALKLTFAMHDYHLNGILGKSNNRYGWQPVFTSA